MDKLHLVSPYLCEDLIRELRGYLNDHPCAKLIRHSVKALKELYGCDLVDFGFRSCFFHTLPDCQEDDGWLCPVPEPSKSWNSIIKSIKIRKIKRQVVKDMKFVSRVYYFKKTPTVWMIPSVDYYLRQIGCNDFIFLNSSEVRLGIFGNDVNYMIGRQMDELISNWFASLMVTDPTFQEP